MHIPLSRNEILELEQCYLQLPSYEGMTNRWADETIARTLAAARERGYMTPDDLEATAKWKYPGKRLLDLVRENTADKLQENTRISFASSTTERNRVGALLELRGVGWPMASVILHFTFPDEYPIIDVRVLTTIGCLYKKDSFNFDRWTEFTDFCKDACVEFGVSMRELDRALWTYDKRKK